MKSLQVKFDYCYGIKSLAATTFDFTSGRTHIIYAPNGTMKSSFARVFKDIKLGNEPKDIVTPTNVTTWEVKRHDGIGQPPLLSP